MAKRTPEGLFICPRCNEAKPSSDYYANRSNPHGIQGYCKPCWDSHPRRLAAEERKRESKYHLTRKAYWSDWVDANRDQYNASSRARYHRHIERNRERGRINAQRSRDANRERVNEAAKAAYHADIEASREQGRRAAAIRKARRLGNRCEPYTERDIFDRDGWTCRLCGDPIDPSVPRRDPWGATIDHIHPLSRGGADAPDNVQAAHFRCNVRKHARVA